MKTISFLLLILLLLSHFSCKENTIAQRENLLETDREFAAASAEIGAAEAFKKYLAENALVLPNKYNPLSGRQAIYESMLDTPPEYNLEWTPVDAGVATSGDLSYTWGNFKASWLDESGQRQQRLGKYLNIWKIQEDGSWKLFIDMGNSSPEPDTE